MEIVKWSIVDVHYNKDEQKKADKIRNQLERSGYRLEHEDAGTFTDNCDQYMRDDKRLFK